MESWIDAVGNVHGRINGSFPNSPALVLGSHYDTVLDGGKCVRLGRGTHAGRQLPLPRPQRSRVLQHTVLGEPQGCLRGPTCTTTCRYDGALGIIVGIAAIKATVVEAALKAGIQLPDLVPGQQLVLPPGVAARAAKAFHVRRPLGSLRLRVGPVRSSTVRGAAAALQSCVTSQRGRRTQRAEAGVLWLQLGAAPGRHVAWPSCRACRALPQVPVRLVAFADEEGVRFQSTFLGSRALVSGALCTCPLDQERRGCGAEGGSANMFVGWRAGTSPCRWAAWSSTACSSQQTSRVTASSKC